MSRSAAALVKREREEERLKESGVEMRRCGIASEASAGALSVVGRQAEGDPTFLVFFDSRRLRVAGDALYSLFVDDKLAVLHALGADNVILVLVAVVMMVVVVLATFEFALQSTNVGANVGSRAGPGPGPDGADDKSVLLTTEVAGIVFANGCLVGNFDSASAGRARVGVHNDGAR